MTIGTRRTTKSPARGRSATGARPHRGSGHVRSRRGAGRAHVSRPAAIVSALLGGVVTLGAALATEVATAGVRVQPSVAAGQPGGGGLGPQPWSQRAITAEVGGWTVTSDLGPGRSERWIEAVVGAGGIVAELLGTDGLPARALTPRTLLLFDDHADFVRVLEGRYGAAAAGTAAVELLFDAEQVVAATEPPPPPPTAEADGGPAASPAPPPRASAERDLAAAAADVLAAGAAAALHRPFQDDLPPALAAGLELLAAESVVLDRGIRPGLPRAETLVPAQVVVRDAAPDVIAILALDAAAWDELDPTVRADATLVAWSLVQFATQPEGRRLRDLLRSLAVRVNEGDRPPTAIVRAGGERAWRSALGAWRRWIEEATPAPDPEAAVLVEALAAGLRELAADGLAPSDLDAAAAALADRGFTWRAIRFGAPVEISVEGPATFELDEDADTGRRPQIALVRSRSVRGADGPLPPGIEVRGLRTGRLQVRWEPGEQGPVRVMTVR